MKTYRRLSSLGLVGLMALGPVLDAPPQVVPADPVPKESVVQKTTRLIRYDAYFANAIEPPVAPNLAPAADHPVVDNPDQAVVFDTLVVREKRIPVLPPVVHETTVAEVLRTGTLWERIGHRFSTRFWARGDKGLMLTLSW